MSGFRLAPPFNISQMSDANLPFTRDHLTDGYIPNTFGPQNAASYLVRLFQVAATLVRAGRHRGGAFYAFNRPSHNSLPAISVNGQHAWLLDHAVRRGGSVVPQQLWSPQSQGDRLRTPIFFVNMDGSIGVPVMSAAAGYMRLLGTILPPQLDDKTMIRIRIGWPGYAPSEYQVQVRDQTQARNPITLERFVEQVGIRVQQVLANCERAPFQGSNPNWRVGGHGNITSNEAMLIGLIQVSEGSWMPILQLMRRVVH